MSAKLEAQEVGLMKSVSFVHAHNGHERPVRFSLGKSAFWAIGFVFSVGFVLPAAAQFPPGAPAASQTQALGGSIGARGMARPLGGVRPPGFAAPGVPGARGPARPGFRGGVAGVPYAYSVYVPNYFDSYADQYGYAPYAPVASQPFIGQQAAPGTPVIINQYFTGTPADQNQPPQQDSPPPGAQNQPAADIPGGTLAPAENYYLIAYKNHSVYAALAYWVEDDTLHYVTTQNTHNQASLALIDIDLTKNLNQARNVPFSLPGR